jgi:hypothetical protein
MLDMQRTGHAHNTQGAVAVDTVFGTCSTPVYVCCCHACRTQPLGVLHDLLTPRCTQWPSQQQQQQQQHRQQSCPVVSTGAIPWCLTVHFRNRPASLDSSWQNSGTAQDHYLSSLKVGGLRWLLGGPSIA